MSNPQKIQGKNYSKNKPFIEGTEVRVIILFQANEGFKFTNRLSRAMSLEKDKFNVYSNTFPNEYLKNTAEAYPI